MIKQESMEGFIHDLASKAPVPGGGGASALGGAIGSALGSMVGNLTLGKKKYADVQEDIRVLLEKLAKNQEELLELIEKDARAFEPLSKAYGLPKATEEEAAYKAEVMEEALLHASLIPLEIMNKAYDAILLEEEMAGKGTRIAISDVAVGVQFLRAALLGASMNIFINTGSMKNRIKAEELNREANRLILEGTALADRIFEEIRGKL